MNKHPHHSIGSFDFSQMSQRGGKTTYFRAGNNYIFVDPVMITRDSTNELLETIRKKDNQHIHIFIDQMYPDMIVYLSAMMIMVTSETTANKVTIHVNKNKTSLGNMIEVALHGIPVKHWNIAHDGDSVSFKINTIWLPRDHDMHLHDQFLVFRYEREGLTASVDLIRFDTPIDFCTNEWSSTSKKKLPDGPFVDEKFRNGMDQFRDLIIQKFKEACPPGILKGFKTDEEIWAFMKEQSDISVKAKEAEDKKEEG